MFGYVKPFVPELKVAQHEIYRAAYCGLCRSMGRVTGQLSRMTLSYDLVFLAAVRMILEDITPAFEQSRCAAHPMKKRMIMLDNGALAYTAAMSAVLAGEKRDTAHVRVFAAGTVLADVVADGSADIAEILPMLAAVV